MGAEVARYQPRRGNEDAIVLGDGRRLAFSRPRKLRSERVLVDGERELARLRPSGWKSGIWKSGMDLELDPDGLVEPDLTVPILLAFAVLVNERDAAAATAASGGGAVAGAGS